MMYLWLFVIYGVLGTIAVGVLFPTRREFDRPAPRHALEPAQRPVDDYAGSVASVVVRGVGSRVVVPLRAARGYVARHAARVVGLVIRRHRRRGGVHPIAVDPSLELWVDASRGTMRAGRHSLEARALACALLEA